MPQGRKFGSIEDVIAETEACLEAKELNFVQFVKNLNIELIHVTKLF